MRVGMFLDERLILNHITGLPHASGDVSRTFLEAK